MDMQQTFVVVAATSAGVTMVVRKAPDWCKEAEKAVRAVRSLWDVIRGHDRQNVNRARSTGE
ncbi:hypothetical protein AB0D97_13965 [Streptomyces roseus]|uniref:hypothetical protein n=1 Tax=Streptomyces roseus TaxID=66430 RepID=UPI0033DAA259